MAECLARGITSGGREVSKQLDLGHSKLTIGQSHHLTMIPENEKNFTEVVNVGRQVPAEDKNVVRH